MHVYIIDHAGFQGDIHQNPSSDIYLKKKLKNKIQTSCLTNFGSKLKSHITFSFEHNGWARFYHDKSWCDKRHPAGLFICNMGRYFDYFKYSLRYVNIKKYLIVHLISFQ